MSYSTVMSHSKLQSTSNVASAVRNPKAAIETAFNVVNCCVLYTSVIGDLCYLVGLC